MAEKQETAGPPNVERAVEATEPPRKDIEKLCKETFNKTSLYLEGELKITAEEYLLLENMNRTTTKKYDEMRMIAKQVDLSLKELMEKYNSLQPFLEQLDQIEKSVTSLEQTAYQLDAYCKKLETKYKKLERK
ncbi:unnamed protein product [Dimorphilus gyrociliatus]|uniref:Uncharacterized protein n=1 Tax=Dimorphilus gyrociliatus TaxID=2664684 RepID=A0A7I8W0Y4_9ANNE|nr:unnamed protein product [Dimorphilus gyrociliatus]